MSGLNPGVYDAVAGADQNTLNAAVASFYAAFPAVFNQSFPINADNITTIDVSFAVAPTVAVGPPSSFLEEARAFATDGYGTRDHERVIRELTAGTLTASCSQVTATINSTPPIPNVTASVVCGAAANIQQNAQGQNVLVVTLAGATFQAADDPSGVITGILNSLLAPQLLPFLNNVLSGIEIPVLSLLGVTFVPPSITDETGPDGDPYVVGYTGLGPVTLPDPGTAWPEGTAFIGIDSNALNTVANNALPSPSGSGGTDDFLNLSWDYGIQFSADLQLQPGAGNTVSGQLNIVNGGASITWHTPNGFPNITFGASISGSVDVAAALAAVPNSSGGQDIQVTIENISNFNIDVSIDGLPSLIAWALDQIVNALVNFIAPAVSAALQNYAFTVYSLNPFGFSILGSSGTLALSGLQLNQIAGAGGLPLAVVTATPAFSAAPSVSVRTSYTHTLRHVPGRVRALAAV